MNEIIEKNQRPSLKKQMTRVNFEFPKEEYRYLKMLCAKKGVSLREFATNLLLKAITDFEDEELGSRALERSKEKGSISFDDILE